MLLTFNQTLFLILTVAAVVIAVFLVLFLIQLRRTAREAEKSFQELQVTLDKLKKIEDKLDHRLDETGKVIESAKKTVSGLSELSLFLTTRVIRPASRYWPVLFPLVRFGWQMIKKRKEKKNGR
ncbi:MAG: DUF948 domain-containing protein [Candidatus Saccharicenans sp.]|jgi:uncharacterized protein YoxC|nr:DUF948 domain-containing protein [Candidatus Saccharicenans sp.]HOJ26931.1 DUF948 domain-containing protein [Candidatus Saccharicenans sp.]HOL45987.1 DUF948 domain-containing protein [Candidatus Saccharicenans sp.]HPP24738.1 DUF948 domain-containing protein [Candidatus Saccharicenans sp.]HQM75223.1 DUF948 domain-containing protein [Candidatus Saccharicenans sp.]